MILSCKLSLLLPGITLNECSTIKVLNFWMPKIFAVTYLKFKQRGQTLGYFVKKMQNGIANSEDPDQTAPLGAV